MSLAVDLSGVGMPNQQAIRLGFQPQTLAGAGTAQVTAGAITANQVVITTAVGETAVRLPADAELMVPYILTNTSATTALVFPPTGGAINGGSADASVNLAQNASAMFFRRTTTAWISIS